ncbi:hypothetical protein LCGC14_0521280 [marine sediment metagenome]|uniref:S-adenosylmethionine decarboxylase proenzyme n=1 Tax=marine sediment metagenome TaxID=412755 RepID=A0A0F9V6H8_9ZZZZ
MKVGDYGKELIIDLHDCDVSTFNRNSLDAYFEQICRTIKMQKCERYFWDDVGVPKEERQTEPHLKGTSAIQFMLTSNITIHTLSLLQKVFINIFSCKDFDSDIAAEFSREWFGGRIVHIESIWRI